MTKFIVALTALLTLASCSEKEKPNGNVHISGNIAGLKSGTLYIEQLQDTVLVALDSIKINGDSTFESHFTIDSPEMLYLSLDRGVSRSIDNKLMFFAEPGNINIESNLEHFYASAKITGSKNHDLFEEYRKVSSRFNNQQLDLTEARLNAYKDKKPYSAEEDKNKSDAIQKRKYLYAINFALNNREHEIAPYIALAEINNAGIKFLDTINKSLAPKVAKSKYGKILAEHVSERKKSEQ